MRDRRPKCFFLLNGLPQLLVVLHKLLPHLFKFPAKHSHLIAIRVGDMKIKVILTDLLGRQLQLRNRNFQLMAIKKENSYHTACN